jgi:hypothetical protein
MHNSLKDFTNEAIALESAVALVWQKHLGCWCSPFEQKQRDRAPTLSLDKAPDQQQQSVVQEKIHEREWWQKLPN